MFFLKSRTLHWPECRSLPSSSWLWRSLRLCLLWMMLAILFSASFLHSLIYLEGGPARVHTGSQRTPSFSGPGSLPLCRSQGLSSGWWAAAGTSTCWADLMSQMLALWGALVSCISRYSTVGVCLTTPWLEEDLRYGDKGRWGNACQYLFVCVFVCLFLCLEVKFGCCADRTSFMNSGDSPAPASWAPGTTGMHSPP